MHGDSGRLVCDFSHHLRSQTQQTQASGKFQSRLTEFLAKCTVTWSVWFVTSATASGHKPSKPKPPEIPERPHLVPGVTSATASGHKPSKPKPPANSRADSLIVPGQMHGDSGRPVCDFSHRLRSQTQQTQASGKFQSGLT